MPRIIPGITRAYLAGIGRKGGSVKSAAKTRAARENGKRPKRKRAAKQPPDG